MPRDYGKCILCDDPATTPDRLCPAHEREWQALTPRGNLPQAVRWQLLQRRHWNEVDEAIEAKLREQRRKQ